MEEGKKKGEKWPGYQKRMVIFTVYGRYYQPEFHMLDFDILSKAIREAGFIMEYFEEIPLFKKPSKI